MPEPIDAAISVPEKIEPKIDVLHQFAEKASTAHQRLLAIEEKRKTEGPLFDFDNQVVTALAGINDRKIVEKEGRVYWVGGTVHSAAKQLVSPIAIGSAGHEDYKMLFGRVDSHPDTIIVVANSFGVKLPVSEEPTSAELSTLIFDYIHGATNAKDGSTPRELPEGAIKGVDYVEIPTNIDGLTCILNNGNREGHTISLVLKPSIVEELYQGMYESGYVDPQGDGTNKMIAELFPRSHAANLFIEERRNPPKTQRGF